jgi:hypothetical protein
VQAHRDAIVEIIERHHARNGLSEYVGRSAPKKKKLDCHAGFAGSQ